MAALAARAAAGLDRVAGAAAGKVFEVDALAQTRGGRPETFAGWRAGDLVGAVVDTSLHNRRAGELLAQGVPAADIGRSIVQAADAVDSVELLAQMARDAHVYARPRRPRGACAGRIILINGRPRATSRARLCRRVA